MARDPDPTQFTDLARIRALISNARRLKREDLVVACQARIAQLAGNEYDDEIEQEFWRSVTMAEEIRTLENGKTTRLSRTRQKRTRDGALKCIADVVAKSETSDGFQMLLDAKHPELLFEAIVLRHTDKFEPGVIAEAERKITDAGLEISDVAKGAGE